MNPSAPMSDLFFQEPASLSVRGGLDYAHLLSRCYLNRVEITMSEHLPLVRQWILLRTLCSRR